MSLRVAAVAALALFVAVGAISDLLFLAAFQYRPDWFADPAQVVAGGDASAALFKWAALTDLFSYYLPTGVVALALWVALHQRGTVLATAGLAAAFGYVLVGGAGAAVLAMAGGPLIAAYDAPLADRVAVATTFGVLVDTVFRAVWQLIDGILLAVWMLATGCLVGPWQAGFGRLSLILGALFAIGAALTALDLGAARDVGLGIVFVLWVIWSVWLAVLIWHRRAPFDALDAASAMPGRETRLNP